MKLKTLLAFAGVPLLPFVAWPASSIYGSGGLSGSTLITVGATVTNLANSPTTNSVGNSDLFPISSFNGSVYTLMNISIATLAANLKTNGLQLALGYSPMTNSPYAICTTLQIPLPTNSVADALHRGVLQWIGYTPPTNSFSGLVSALGFNPATNSLAGVVAALGYTPSTNSLAGVVAALGYTPSTNSLTGILAALGYTPSTNSLAGIKAALGYTPATNSLAGVLAALGYTPLTNSFSAVTNALGYRPATNGVISALGASHSVAVVGTDTGSSALSSILPSITSGASWALTYGSSPGNVYGLFSADGFFTTNYTGGGARWDSAGNFTSTGTVQASNLIGNGAGLTNVAPGFTNVWFVDLINGTNFANRGGKAVCSLNIISNYLQSGDVVYLSPGTDYVANFTIPDNVVIKGTSKDVTRIVENAATAPSGYGIGSIFRLAGSAFFYDMAIQTTNSTIDVTPFTSSLSANPTNRFVGGNLKVIGLSDFWLTTNVLVGSISDSSLYLEWDALAWISSSSSSCTSSFAFRNCQIEWNTNYFGSLNNHRLKPASYVDVLFENCRVYDYNPPTQLFTASSYGGSNIVMNTTFWTPTTKGSFLANSGDSFNWYVASWLDGRWLGYNTHVVFAPGFYYKNPFVVVKNVSGNWTNTYANKMTFYVTGGDAANLRTSNNISELTLLTPTNATLEVPPGWLVLTNGGVNGATLFGNAVGHD